MSNLEFTEFEREIRDMVKSIPVQSTPQCLAPDAFLELAERGETHPRSLEWMEHIAFCPRCSAEWTEVLEIWNATHPKQAPTPSLWQRFTGWLRATPGEATGNGDSVTKPLVSTPAAQPQWRPTPVFYARPALAAIILALFCTVSYFAGSLRTPKTTAPAPGKPISDPQQVARLQKENAEIQAARKQEQQANSKIITDLQKQLQTLNNKPLPPPRPTARPVSPNRPSNTTDNASDTDWAAALIARDIKRQSLLIPEQIASMQAEQRVTAVDTDVKNPIKMTRPIATCVRWSNLEFGWTTDSSVVPKGQGVTYEIRIFPYENPEKVLKSKFTTQTHWRPAAEDPSLQLPRGVRLGWQIFTTLQDRKEFGRTPSNDDKAPFILLDPAQEQLLDDLRKYISSPLQWAALSSRFGLIEEAEAALKSIPPSSKEAGNARIMLQQLQKLRKTVSSEPKPSPEAPEE